MFRTCGCCGGIGKVWVIKSTCDITHMEDCSNCNGSGIVFSTENLNISFKRNDELPKVKYK